MTGQDLKKIRLYIGFNIREMAQVLGVHRQTYLKWERGEQAIPAIGVTTMEMLIFLKENGKLLGWLWYLSSKSEFYEEVEMWAGIMAKAVKKIREEKLSSHLEN